MSRRPSATLPYPSQTINRRFKDDSEKLYKPQEKKSVSYFKLYKYAKPSELILILIGVIMATVNAIFVPLGIILYGEFTALLIDRTVMNGTSTRVYTLNYFGGGKILTNASAEENREALIKDSEAFGIGCLLFSIAQFVAAAISVDLFNYSALNQISRMKVKLLEAVLRQDQTWYDLNTDMNFATKVSDDLEKYREGIAEKVAIFVYLVMSFVISAMISFWFGWELTLVVLSCAPVIATTALIISMAQSKLTTKELKAYSHAGVAAEEALSSIRTVAAFGGEKIEVQRFADRLKPAKRVGIKKGLFSGLGCGSIWFIVYVTYAISFYYGVGLILKYRHDENPLYTPAVLMIVFFSVLQGAQNLGLTPPQLEAMSTAKASATSVFGVINRVPVIDIFSTRGSKPSILGDIELKDVHFRYPARLDVEALCGLNLKIATGETVALVGQSGCGKSTVLQLIQRMYDPTSGTIFHSGHNVKTINVKHLRDHIAVVGQEPVLFAGTIRENIRMSNPSCTDEEIYKAAKQAFCHSFITMLPEGYDTMMGERGAQLSGGQKQRIAIARALVRKPKILILDEATSALDSHSEAMVQKALDAASQGRTTVMVSHRLATVVNADRVVFLDNGDVLEEGTHQELLSRKGHYYRLVLESDPQLANVNLKATSKHVQIQTMERDEYDEDVRESRRMGETEEPTKKEEKEFTPSTWQILSLCGQDRCIMLAGIITAIFVGFSFPLFAVLLGETYGMFEHSDDDYVRQRSIFISLMFLLLGLSPGIGLSSQIFLFNWAGVRLTTRLRIAAFATMLKQEIGWFDDPKNGVGALGARLASDAAAVQGATGVRIGTLMQAFATVSVGVILSLYYSWLLTLVSIVNVPLVILAVILEGKVLAAGLQIVRKTEERATAIATEAITNIKTVCAFCGERAVVERYERERGKARKVARKNLRWRGLVFAFGQVAPVVGFALSFWYGGLMVADKEIHYKDVIKVSEALIFGSWMLGQALAFAPNFGAAVSAAGRIMTMLKREPLVQSTKAPAIPEHYVAKGKINYENIKFRYPTRREVQVLKGLTLEIPVGKRVAFVGQSGCGKSTLIQLLQRLYDPDFGCVYLDDHNVVTDIRLTTLRHNLGIVSQEPVLFDRSIRENIAYGDNTREVSIEDIVKAAKTANVHSFIAALPEGYETRIGAHASQLSGGQKQRIAIARALIREPRVLLLDEATSALDTHSEKIVQEALDKASEGRTCLIIAHRLATIQTADMIVVINEGKIAESGTHDELIKLQGIYAKLYELQGGVSMTQLHDQSAPPATG